MSLYFVFFDINGYYQVFRVVSQSNYLTHTVVSLFTVDCLPVDMCTGYLGKLVKGILPYGWDRYVFMRLRIGGRFRKNEILVISGRMKPRHGVLAFYPGYDYAVFTSKLEGKMEELYRNLYYDFKKDIMAALDELSKNLENNISVLSDITKRFTDILKKYDEYLARSVGLLSKGSEALTLVETGLVQLTSPPPPPPPSPPTPPPPPRRGLIERLKGIFRRGG